MSKQNTDLTFFTNGPHQTLLDRFKATLACVDIWTSRPVSVVH